ncbi:uncharacterized protein [Coffea arabica]|uniref:Uncharacterized protein isoform X1 n=1 Tax=Coffea arabica TaxID=13443 RepID=A0ABM4WDI6_COFAR
MRILAARLSTYLCRRNPLTAQSRNLSSFHGRDERSIEEEAERKIGWFLKLIFAGTATVVAYQFLPYMGDNLMLQSVSLLQVKDPLFKRMGASRLAHFAIDDERRMKIVEIGGAQELLNMLGTAKDDRTRKEALRALDAISKSDSGSRMEPWLQFLMIDIQEYYFSMKLVALYKKLEPSLSSGPSLILLKMQRSRNSS